MGATGAMLTNWVGDGHLTKYSARFTRQVWPGDDLLARATITIIFEESGETLLEMDVLTTNQNGQAVIIGKATARIDILNNDIHQKARLLRAF